MDSETGTVYTYIARDRSGRRSEGRVVSTGPEEAIRRLEGLGLYPSRLMEVGSERITPLSPDRLARFMEKMATLLSAGTPLTTALAALGAERDPTAAMVARLDRDIRAGRSFAEAACADKSFDRVTLSLLESGEATGQLDRALTDAAQAIDRRQESIRLAADTFRYPALVAGAALGASLILSALVFPKLAAAYATIDLPLPAPTLWLMALGAFITGPWGVATGVVSLIAAGLFIRWGRTEPGRRQIDRWVRATPFVGELIARLAVARGGATLATLLTAGIPIVSALKIAAPTGGSPLLADAFETAAVEIEGGRTLTDALGSSRLVPELAMTMISVGEQAGSARHHLHEDGRLLRSGRTCRASKTAAVYLEPALAGLPSHRGPCPRPRRLLADVEPDGVDAPLSEERSAHTLAGDQRAGNRRPPPHRLRGAPCARVTPRYSVPG